MNAHVLYARLFGGARDAGQIETVQTIMSQAQPAPTPQYATQAPSFRQVMAPKTITPSIGVAPPPETMPGPGPQGQQPQAQIPVMRTTSAPGAGEGMSTGGALALAAAAFVAVFFVMKKGA